MTAPAKRSKGLLVAAILGVAALAAVGIIGLVVVLGEAEEKPIGADDVLPPEAQARAAGFESVLAAIRRIDVERAPAVTVDGYSGVRPPTFVEGTERTSATETTLLVYPADLKHPEGSAIVPYSVPHGGLFRCMSSLKEVRGPAKRSYDRRTLEGCSTLEHLFVVRNLAVVEPSIPHTTEEGTTRTHHMTKGTVRGEALVFEIATGQLLGGFRFAAASSAEPPNANLGEPNELLRKDLEKNVRAAFEAAATTHRRP